MRSELLRLEQTDRTDLGRERSYPEQQSLNGFGVLSANPIFAHQLCMTSELGEGGKGERNFVFRRHFDRSAKSFSERQRRMEEDELRKQ